MAPVSTGIPLPWYQRPLPFPVFSVLNLASPLALPLAALLATSWVYVHMQADRLSALSDGNFTDPLHYEVYDFIVSTYSDSVQFSRYGFWRGILNYFSNFCISVGGGSAGAVVANRLSKHNRVLLLEAGGNPHPISVVPISLSALLSQPGIDWQYETEPQKFAAFGLKDQVKVILELSASKIERHFYIRS